MLHWVTYTSAALSNTEVSLSIRHANIEFNSNGTPVATDFEDVYFSDAEGLAETEYVFLQQNGLPERWSSHSNRAFTIAETGFGTGLNFLVTLHLFEQYLAANPNSTLKLHFISIEKFPIEHTQLTQALAAHPILAQHSQALLEQYPVLIEGCHRLSFLNHTVTLDLWFGDVHTVLEQIENTPKGLVDTWFLDGFAPSKNPDMWTQKLFNDMARLAKPDCRLATFTAAGIVKRGLVEAGFVVSKQKGFGRKRHMVTGVFPEQVAKAPRLPYFSRYSAQPNAATSSKPTIAIIGGGLAAANCAYALAKKGLPNTVYCKDEALAQGASGNPLGGFYPQLNAEASHASLIHAHSFSYASRVYKTLLQTGHNFSHDWCGTLLVAFNEKLEARYQKLQDKQIWPPSLIHPVDSQQASQLAKIDIPYTGLFVPDAGWINPPQLVQALLDGAKSTIELNCTFTGLARTNHRWRIQWADNTSSQADIVIFATGSESVDIPQLQGLPHRLVRGQVEAVPTTLELNPLATVLCHKGYFTPSWQGHHAMGSTYVKQDRACEYRHSEQITNIAMHKNALDKCSWIRALPTIETGRAAIRCSTPDHLPMVGAVPDLEAQKQQYAALYKALPPHKYPIPNNHSDLYVLNGLGSRGLSTAPLCAEILASQICGEPLPLANHLLDALNPNRFLIRELIRREVHLDDK